MLFHICCDHRGDTCSAGGARVRHGTLVSAVTTSQYPGTPTPLCCSEDPQALGEMQARIAPNSENTQFIYC